MDPTNCGLVDKFRDLVLNLIWEQLLYLVYYGTNIEQLNEQLQELTLERCAIQHRIDEATNNADKIEESVLHWLQDVDEISEQVQKLLRASQAKAECSMTSCPNLWLRYKLSKRAKAMAQKVVDIYGKRNFDRVSYHVPPPSMLELTNGESNEGIYSRVLIMNQIIEALRNPEVNIIGLCGLGGVGKTTIAKEVEKNQKMFEKVIMATVSKELNVKKIQGQIAEKLGMQLNEKTKDVRASHLYERLKQEKNMLLILDDLWEDFDLKNVGIPFVDVENYTKKNEGCKILLISRNETLLSSHMKCQKVIKVDVLLENEAWELFKRIAKLSIDLSGPDLISIAFKIVQKSGGLPLVIATVAKALRKKDLNEWKDSLARLNNPLRRNFTGIKEVDNILKLSYDHLSSSEYKRIFLLASMLSHDPSIEDLLIYSVGLDILKHIENLEDVHVGISTIVSKLRSSNLFLNSFSSHHVTIHDVIRDFALSIASDELCAFIVRHRTLTEWPDEHKLERYKGIWLERSDISDLPKELHAPELEFFLLNSTNSDLTIPTMFFKSSKNLKVLAFTGVHFSLLPSLSFLQKLKALCLHSCLLKDITEVKSLKSLKVLSFAYSEIQCLPIELAELTSLQMLNLSNCSELKVIPHKLLSNLKKLEVLCMANSFDQWKVEGSSAAHENASLDELKDLPISSLDIQIPNVSLLPENLFLDMNLKRYRIFIGKRWKWQRNYETSKILKLELGSSIHLKRGVRKLLEGVEDLYLYGSNAVENVLHSHDERGFLHLRNFRIKSNETATNKIFESLFSKKVLLPKLEILKLSHLNSLIPLIWDNQLSHNSLSNLKTLIVKGCGFVKLVPLHMLTSLNKLEELEVSKCDMLEKVFDFEDSKDYKEMESSSVVVPLKKLKLRSLPKLKNVWSNHCQGIVSFQSLISVYAYNCGSLTSIFPATIAKGMLCDLENLEIDNCGIDVIVANDQVSESVVSTFEFPRLTSLVLSDLPNLRNFYPHRHTLEWPHLQQLSIMHCDKLEIFEKEVSNSSEIHEEESSLGSKYPLLFSNKVIHNLEELRLRGKEAETIGSGQLPIYHFPKVKLLYLNVEKTTTISYRLLWKSFPNLEELELRGEFKEAFGGDDSTALAGPFIKLTLNSIFNTMNLTPSLVSSPNLTHLEVAWCLGLNTLMTLSTARSLVHLTRLSIHNCDKMEEIITKQEQEDDMDKEIFFGKLKFLELAYLQRLKRFCGHNYTFKFPLLEYVTITSCHQLKVFFCSGAIHTPQLQSIKLDHKEIRDTNLNKIIFYHQRFVKLGKLVLDEKDAFMIRNDQFPDYPCPEVEILRIKSFVDEGVTFPYTLLERFPQLNALHVDHCSFEEIFPSHAQVVDCTGNIPLFKELYLDSLNQLKNIWRDDSQLPTFQNLEILYVQNCSNLIKLAPSSTSFHNLTVLKVSNCHQLIYLVTNSTAKSLVNLETLEIYACEKLEEIITKQEGEDDEDKEILFSKLSLLKLHRLQRLKRFCSHNYTFRFPLLERVTIIQCRQLTVFYSGTIYTPQLKSIKLDNKEIQDTNLSKSIFYQQRFDISGKLVLDENDVCMIRSDQFPAGPCPEVEILLIARFSVKGETFPYTLLERFPQLNALHVGDSSFGEIFPLYAPCSISFHNLTVLKVFECHQLVHLMTNSTVESLVNLETLEIDACDKLEEIVKKENEDVEGGLIFKGMRMLKLTHLPRLKIEEDTSDFNIKGKATSTVGCRNIFKSLFSPNKVLFSKLEILELSHLNRSISLKWDDQFSHNSFSNLKTLIVKSCGFVKLVPLHVLKSLNNLEELEVEDCNLLEMVFAFDALNDYKEKDSSSTVVALKKLKLCELPKLKSVWSNNLQGAISLTPSLVSSPNLTHLEVTFSYGLTTLMMSSTARSLAHLTHLSIGSCRQIEEIITKQEGEDDEHNEIFFNKLKFLELNDLSQLKRFCSHNYTFRFSLLESVTIVKCPQLTTFCPGAIHTPLLQNVRVDRHASHKDIWKINLNNTIQHRSTI